MVENSDKTWSTEEGNGKPLQFSCLENPMNSMKRQNERTLKDELWWVELNSPIPVHFSSLIPKMSMFTLAISYLTTSLIHGANIPGSYAVFFTASDLTSITNHIHNWVLFLLWLCLFILSGVISPLISSSILDTYRLCEFIFQCPIFLPFHTLHGVLKARILKWFAIPFSSESHFVRTLHHDLSVLGGPTWHGS